ncbi:MAG: hypothetical protein IT207_03670 [Fimbriimonadaceae bacterium]|nr:hypothetical protein [Fimbriimonadaceae bacterium]
MKQNRSVWDKLQGIDRRILYSILMVLTSVPLFITVALPVDPDPSSKDFYATLMAVPPDQTVFLQSDWTNSTRGENGGHMESIFRILMSKKQKFVIYSLADPQAPQVFRDVMLRINQERESQGLPRYKPWVDYVDLGFFANAEGTTVSIGNDVRQTFGSRRAKDETGVERNVFESPVLQPISKVGDAGLFLIVTASNTIDYAVQRLSGKVKMACACTGVIGPSALVYYQSKQLEGVAVGLKGVYDIEYMMNYGLNVQGADGKTMVSFSEKPTVTAPPLTEGTKFGRGSKYFASLHAALGLVILAVVLGNVGMFASRKKEKQS